MSLEELSWEITIKILSPNIWKNLGKVGVETSYLQSQMHSEYDSAESIADSDLEDGELRNMLASPLFLREREENSGSSRRPTASGNQKQWQYRREGQVHNVLKLITEEEKARCQVHLKSRERLGNRMQCFHQRAPNRETSSRVLFFKFADPSNWEDLFLRTMKIICSVRQDLNL